MTARQVRGQDDVAAVFPNGEKLRRYRNLANPAYVKALFKEVAAVFGWERTKLPKLLTTERRERVRLTEEGQALLSSGRVPQSLYEEGEPLVGKPQEEAVIVPPPIHPPAHINGLTIYSLHSAQRKEMYRTHFARDGIKKVFRTGKGDLPSVAQSKLDRRAHDHHLRGIAVGELVGAVPNAEIPLANLGKVAACPREPDVGRVREREIGTENEDRRDISLRNLLPSGLHSRGDTSHPPPPRPSTAETSRLHGLRTIKPNAKGNGSPD